MARRRFQDPRPRKEGHWWYLRVWKDHFDPERRTWERKRERIRLGPATLPEREARRLAEEQVRPMNQGLVTVGGAVTFGHFVQHIYKTTTAWTGLAASTRARYATVIRKYLESAFGNLPLRDLTKLLLDQFFSRAAQWNLAHKSIVKIREALASILNAAVKYEFLVKNSIESVKLPRPREGRRIKPWITPEQLKALVALIAEPYATMVFVAVYTGLRVSELLALRWRNIRDDSISIEERYCRGDWGAPKSQASNTTIPVNRAVIGRIHKLKVLTVPVRCGCSTRFYPALKSCGRDDLVFQSPIKGAPMRDGNILRRHIKPAGRKLGIPWINWLVLRRSFATWLAKANVPVKDAQALMRHSRASLTLDIYQQFIPEGQRQAVEQLPGLVQESGPLLVQ